MSTFFAYARHPKNREIMKCEFRDDMFGIHKYGVIFPNGEIFDQEKWKIERITDKETFEDILMNKEVEKEFDINDDIDNWFLSLLYEKRNQIVKWKKNIDKMISDEIFEMEKKQHRIFSEN